MSAEASQSSSTPRCTLILRSADQYHLWKARVADACYAAVYKDVFAITDNDCRAAIQELEEKQGSDRAKFEWVGKIWSILTSSLHDDVYRKVNHIQRGYIKSLLDEISHTLVVNNMEEVGPLRLELYGGTMEKDGSNDLQLWINFVVERGNKLLFLKKEVPQEELVTIFLKGLHDCFEQLQVYFAIPGQMPKTLEQAVTIVRKHAQSPAMVGRLAKLKAPGLSQNLFPAIAPQPATATQPAKSRQQIVCRQFSEKGTCSYGAKCRFKHTATPGSGPPSQGQPNRNYNNDVKCGFCSRPGHSEQECRTKQRLLTQVRNEHAALATPTIGLNQSQPSETKSESQAQTTLHFNSDPFSPFTFMMHTNGVSQHQNVRDASKTGAFQHQVEPGSVTSSKISVFQHKSDWVMDSGATCCATFDENECIDVVACNINVTAAGSSFRVYKAGTVLINTVDDLGRPVQLKMRNTLIAPEFPLKLLALQMFTAKDFEVTLRKHDVLIKSPHTDFVFVGRKDPQSLLYFLQTAAKPAPEIEQASHSFLAKTYGAPQGSTIDLLWKLHLRHGHRNFNDIARQYNIPVPKQTPACVSCIMGKSHKHPHVSDGFERATRRAEGFHSDFRGPFSVQTPQGHLHLCTIIDDYSDLIFGFLAKSHTEWYDIWTNFVRRVETEIGKSNCIAWLLSDNGSVYTADQTKTFCLTKGIRQRFSIPYAQWMNHTAERNMRTIGEMAVTTMVHANLPKFAWGYAVMLAIQVINRTVDSSDRNKQAGVPAHFSRLEKWKGKELPGQTKALYPLGCLAFKHVPPELRSKLDAHAAPHVYLGIDPKSGAFLLGSLFKLELTCAVDVTFVENVFPFRKLKHNDAASSLLWDTQHNMAEGDPRLGMFGTPDSSGVTQALDLKTLKSLGAVSTVEEVDAKVASTPVTSDPTPVRRSSRAHVAPDMLTYSRPTIKPSDPLFLLALSETQLQTITPKSADQALKSISSVQWQAAMNREKDCHVKNGTFGEPWDSKNGPCPKAIPAAWVFKIKHRGEPIEETALKEKQFKARVVIRGQFMQEGLDFNDTFAPVAKQVSIRSLFAVATKHGCMLKAGDIETAFLSADMDCDVWVKMPPFWGCDDEAITPDKKYEPAPRKLLKGVPGIPQGSRLFNDAFTEHLKTMGWQPSAADKCVYLNSSLSEHAAVVIWVDDFIFMHEKDETWTTFIAQLRKRFNVPAAGDLVTFLGMDIKYDRSARTMHISQANCVANLLERAKMSDCNPAPTPCAAGFIFTKKDCPTTPQSDDQCKEYRSLVALANFISCWTRPDITYTVNKLCKFMSNPGPAHWQALKHLLRYLKGTASMGLYYNFIQQARVASVHGYSDSSWADCVDSSKSTIGYIFFYHNAPISWFSKLHSYVTTCTNHAEYAALATAAKEAQWLVYLFDDLQPHQKHVPMPLFTDNSGVVSLVFNPVDHQSNKHVRISCHFARELTELKVIAPQRVPTTDNLADTFTKALPGPVFRNLVAHYVQQAPCAVPNVRGGVSATTSLAFSPKSCTGIAANLNMMLASVGSSIAQKPPANLSAGVKALI